MPLLNEGGLAVNAPTLGLSKSRSDEGKPSAEHEADAR